MAADALATKGLVAINPSGAGYEAFADALATRGWVFLVHEITIVEIKINRLFEVPSRIATFFIRKRSTTFVMPKRETTFYV